MLDYERCDVYPYKGEMWVRLYLPWLTAQEKKILKEYHVRDEGRAYVVEGPKNYLQKLCENPLTLSRYRYIIKTQKRKGEHKNEKRL